MFSSARTSAALSELCLPCHHRASCVLLICRSVACIVISLFK
jgi:hypothetical protein